MNYVQIVLWILQGVLMLWATKHLLKARALNKKAEKQINKAMEKTVKKKTWL